MENRRLDLIIDYNLHLYFHFYSKIHQFVSYLTHRRTAYENLRYFSRCWIFRDSFFAKKKATKMHENDFVRFSKLKMIISPPTKLIRTVFVTFTALKLMCVGGDMAIFNWENDSWNVRLRTGFL